MLSHHYLNSQHRPQTLPPTQFSPKFFQIKLSTAVTIHHHHSDLTSNPNPNADLTSVMSRESLHALESCAFQLHSWRPFSMPLDSPDSPKPYAPGPNTKRPCRSDRATSYSIESVLDMSKLSLFDDDKPPLQFSVAQKRWLARKRRRRYGSRSVSGRSSDRRCRSVGASAANGTCSDLPMAAGGTDSSGELFGEANWASDVSDRNSRREREGNVSGEREHLGLGCGQFGNGDNQGNESGYGSEPGYRGDAEHGYGDEIDEEEDDSRALFWGDEFGDGTSKLERVGENSIQKAHHRGRRKKHDMRMVDAPS